MKKFLLSSILALSACTAFAQVSFGDNAKLSDRLYFGGGLGLNGGTDSYGNRYFFIGLYPIIGYMVNNNLSVGMGINYQYYSYPDVDYDVHQYGVSPFVRYNFGQLFLYGEYSILNTPVYNITTSTTRKNFDRLLLGAGYSQPLGGRGSINVMGAYDVLWNRSEYAFASPWVFRVFFSI